jgi:hypothetical protein
MDLATRVVKQQVVREPSRPIGTNDPTQIRYGWNPFKEFNLCGPDGTIAIYAQPFQIAGPDGEPVLNPYHRRIPKGQLIPFPTFNIGEQGPSPDLRDSTGRATLITITRAVPAAEAIIRVAIAYGDKGFTQLHSLQGMEQEQAQRIFTVVQPFDYPIGRLVDELTFGAEERIDSQEDLVFDLGDGQEYVVDRLQNDTERDIARRLVAEMLVGAEVAFTLADETLSATNTSITTRFAGGQGKVGPDGHDRYLQSEEVGQVVRPLENGKTDNSALESKVDFLVHKEVSREQQAEIDRLKQENEALKQQLPAKPAMEAASTIIYCNRPKRDTGEPCQVPVKNEGDACPHHRDKEIDVAA